MTRAMTIALAAISLLVLVGGCVPDPPPPDRLPTGTCLDLEERFDPDIGYDGPRNGLDNVSVWGSTEGTCTGSFRFQATAVFAPDAGAAQVLCDAHGGATDQAPRLIRTDDSPEPVWLCAIPLHVADEGRPTVGECLAHQNSNEDITYVGGIDDLANLAIHDSTDGSCSGTVTSTATAVWMTALGPADPLCLERQRAAGSTDPDWTATQLRALEYGVSPALWLCNGSRQPAA